MLTVLSFVVAYSCFGYAAHLNPIGTAVTLATFAILAVPGVVLLKWALPPEHGGLPALVFGAVCGLALGRFGLLVAALAFGPGRAAPAVILVVFAAASAVALVRLGRDALPRFDDEDARDGRYILLLLAVLFVVLAVPYWSVGRVQAEGHTFTPYFDRDYMNHIAVTAEVSREFPPQNPYFAGERLHYYWCFHLWPAAVKVLTGLSARDALNQAIPPTAGLFVAALCVWLRLYVPARAARYGAVAVGLFAFSFIGLLFAVKVGLPVLAQLLPRVGVREYSFLSHSWLRDCLYEPHSVTALTLLLGVLYLNHPREPRGWARTGVLTGVGFGAILLTDVFVAFVGLLYFALVNLHDFFANGRPRKLLLLAAGVTIATAAVGVALGVFPLGNRTVRLIPHPAAKIAPIYLLLELGPLFVLGAVGTVLLFRTGGRRYRPLALLFALALVIAFSLRVPPETNIVLRKGLKVAQLPVLVAVGAALGAALARESRRWAVAAAAVVALGLPTLGTDLLLYLDKVGDRSPRTTYIHPEEMELLEWVRVNTPPDVVLQFVNQNRIYGERTPLVLESLAERRSYYGNDELPRTFQVPARLIDERKSQIQLLFDATSGADLRRAVAELPPLYLYVESDTPGPNLAIHQLEAEGLLRCVHQRGRYVLYEVRPLSQERTTERSK